MSQDLRELAARGTAELDGASAREVLAWTDATFGSEYVVASNMADGVLVHLAATVRPGVDVLFLDTGYHFAETLGTRDAVAQVYGVMRQAGGFVDVESAPGQGTTMTLAFPRLRLPAAG